MFNCQQPSAKCLTSVLIVIIAIIVVSSSQLPEYDLQLRAASSPAGSRPTKSYELELVKMIVGRSNNKLVKPQQLDNATFTIKTRLYLIRIQNIDEASETFHSTIRLQLNWQDPALSWSPAEFGGLTEVVVPGGRLWIPDLQIANSVDFSEDFLTDKATFPFRVSNKGEIWYHPTGRAMTRCKVDLRFYPFDIQCCLIIVESVIYLEKELKLATRTDGGDHSKAVSFGMLAENEVWELVGNLVGGQSTSFRSGKRTVFSRVHFWLVMRRKPAFFVVTVIIPTFILAIITLLTYLVPVHYVDRPVQSVTTVLTVAIFEVMVAEKLPNNSANCILTIYLTVIMCASAVTILTTTVCVAIVDPGQFISAPWGIPEVARAIGNAFNCRRRNTAKRLESIGNFAKGAHLAQYDSPSTSRLVKSQNLNNNGIINMKVAKRRHHKRSYYYSSNGGLGSSQHNLQQQQSQCVGDSRRSASKTAWYVAYAINWIGFFICLAPTVALPIIAYYMKPDSVDHQLSYLQHVLNDSQPFSSLYYGE